MVCVALMGRGTRYAAGAAMVTVIERLDSRLREDDNTGVEALRLIQYMHRWGHSFGRLRTG